VPRHRPGKGTARQRSLAWPRAANRHDCFGPQPSTPSSSPVFLRIGTARKRLPAEDSSAGRPNSALSDSRDRCRVLSGAYLTSNVENQGKHRTALPSPWPENLCASGLSDLTPLWTAGNIYSLSMSRACNHSTSPTHLRRTARAKPWSGGPVCKRPTVTPRWFVQP